MKKIFNILTLMPQTYMVEAMMKFKINGNPLTRTDSIKFNKVLGKMEKDKKVIENPSEERIAFFTHLKKEGVLMFDCEYDTKDKAIEIPPSPLHRSDIDDNPLLNLVFPTF